MVPDTTVRSSSGSTTSFQMCSKIITTWQSHLESDNVVLMTEARLWQSQRFLPRLQSEAKSRVLSGASGLAGAGTDSASVWFRAQAEMSRRQAWRSTWKPSWEIYGGMVLDRMCPRYLEFRGHKDSFQIQWWLWAGIGWEISQGPESRVLVSRRQAACVRSAAPQRWETEVRSTLGMVWEWGH